MRFLSCVQQYFSYAFDATILETFSPLLAGGCICVPSAEAVEDLSPAIVMIISIFDCPESALHEKKDLEKNDLGLIEEITGLLLLVGDEGSGGVAAECGDILRKTLDRIKTDAGATSITRITLPFFGTIIVGHGRGYAELARKSCSQQNDSTKNLTSKGANSVESVPTGPRPQSPTASKGGYFESLMGLDDTPTTSYVEFEGFSEQIWQPMCPDISLYQVPTMTGISAGSTIGIRADKGLGIVVILLNYNY
jgi:hypothetical protein